MFKSTQSFIALSLINLTLFSSLGAYAASPAAAIQTTTPEATLVSQALAAAGQGLSPDQAQAVMEQNFNTYSATAPAEGRAERLRSALVDLKVYTSAQADEFMTETQTAATPLLAQQNASQELQASAIETAMAKIAAPQGAQFSACSAKEPVFYLGAAAWFFGSIYAVVDGGLSSGQQDAVVFGSFAGFAAIMVLMNLTIKGC